MYTITPKFCCPYDVIASRALRSRVASRRCIPAAAAAHSAACVAALTDIERYMGFDASLTIRALAGKMERDAKAFRNMEEHPLFTEWYYAYEDAHFVADLNSACAGHLNAAV